MFFLHNLLGSSNFDSLAPRSSMDAAQKTEKKYGGINMYVRDSPAGYRKINIDGQSNDVEPSELLFDPISQTLSHRGHRKT